MKNIDTILFDFDGTLIDTNDLIIRTFRATFDIYFPNMDLTNYQIHSFIGPSLQETFSEYTKDPFLIQDMIETYREFYTEYEKGNFIIYPYVEEVVKDLKERGYNLGILTSKFKNAAWPCYTHYNFDKVFDSFTGLDDVEHPKPHRNAVDVALSNYPDYKGAIMIGDNQTDIMAGKNANIYSAGVAWSFKGEEHLQEVAPDFMLKDMRDIYRVLRIIEGDE